MAQQGLIARAGEGLLDFFVLLLRGAGGLCAAIGSILLVAMSADVSSNEDQFVDDENREIDGDEAKAYGWKSW